jgi:hypothetical protein
MNLPNLNGILDVFVNLGSILCSFPIRIMFALLVKSGGWIALSKTVSVMLVY